MKIQIDPKLLSLVTTVDSDISRVMSEALGLWLKEKLPKCPLTESFCENLQGSCNNCAIANKTLRRR